MSSKTRVHAENDDTVIVPLDSGREMVDSDIGGTTHHQQRKSSRNAAPAAWYEKCMYISLFLAALVLFVVHNAAVGHSPIGIMTQAEFLLGSTLHQSNQARMHVHNNLISEMRTLKGQHDTKENKYGFAPGIRTRERIMVGPASSEVANALKTLDEMGVAWQMLHNHDDIAEASITTGQNVVSKALRVISSANAAMLSARSESALTECHRLVVSINPVPVTRQSDRSQTSSASSTEPDEGAMWQRVLGAVRALESQSHGVHQIYIGVPPFYSEAGVVPTVPPELANHPSVQIVKLPIDFGDANSLMAAWYGDSDLESCVVSISAGAVLPSYALQVWSAWASVFPTAAIATRGVNISCFVNPHSVPFLCDIHHHDVDHNPLLHIRQAYEPACMLQGNSTTTTPSSCVMSPSVRDVTAVDIIDAAPGILLRRKALGTDFANVMRRVALQRLHSVSKTYKNAIIQAKATAVLSHPEVIQAEVRPLLPTDMVDAFINSASLALSSYLALQSVPKIIVPFGENAMPLIKLHLEDTGLHQILEGDALWLDQPSCKLDAHSIQATLKYFARTSGYQENVSGSK